MASGELGGEGAWGALPPPLRCARAAAPPGTLCVTRRNKSPSCEASWARRLASATRCGSTADGARSARTPGRRLVA
eukprot:6881313-Alexandrium_andersonii.AAC.1